MRALHAAGALAALWVTTCTRPPAPATPTPAAAATAGNGDAVSGTLRLPRLFGDGMVLQRDAPIPVWGWAPAPGAAIEVVLGGRSAHATADAEGAWRVEFPALPAGGGPYELTVTAANGERFTARDVLVGDVWVASGQSNMEMAVGASANAAQYIASARDSALRHFTVPESWDETPAANVAGGEWERADPRHVGHFSAVAYHFSRELRQSLGVPVGVIHTSWGGSNVQTWISRQAQGLPEGAAAAALAAERERGNAVRASLRSRIGELPTSDAGLVNGRALWADPALDDASWSTIPVPGLWESAGYADLDGVAWYRTTFTLTADEAARGARLSLGPIDDNDITWVNGVEVGRTNGYNLPRAYQVPAGALRAGANTIAVRVEDGGGGGGIYGPPAELFVEAGGARRPLGGSWRFKVAVAQVGTDGQRLNKIPSLLYNRMVYPLLPYPIKGVIWYQGESNANGVEEAAAYRAQFATLITSWRREWRGGAGGDFPFLWVQLPNYGSADAAPPARSTWATLRESQAAALALPNTGQAVAIDVGEAEDIHPKNKHDVGHRLALVALAKVYGRPVASSGPVYRRHAMRPDGRAVVEFDHAVGGLVARGALGGFAVAGEDRTFHWAQAQVEGDRVVVWSDRVPRPVAVRYAWANNPTNVNLYNRDGLPAAPFRTDAW